MVERGLPEGKRVIHLAEPELICRSVFTYDSICRELALRTGCAIVFPEYTLAPEKKFPVQNEECFAVVKYIALHGKRRSLRTDRFAIAGDSAGGRRTRIILQ